MAADKDKPDEEYGRGHLDGRIEARLASHDAHFTHLNGTTAELVAGIRTLSLEVQRLGDQAVADAATRVTLAAALRDADAVRRQSDGERREAAVERWSPMVKVLAVIGTLTSVGALVLGLTLALTR